jgi:spore coat polysaccharide biosynthesis protein SpsF
LRDEIRLAHLRCTVDNLDDYYAVCRVFTEVTDPVGASWRDLVSILRRQIDTPRGQVPLRYVGDYRGAQLVLGTAQIGMEYGSVTLRVPPSEQEAIRIIHRAITAGVTHLDTARVYGDSERRIGLALQGEWSARAKVITKLDPLREIPDGAAQSDIEAAVRTSIQRSCRELGVKSLHAVLLHRARHRHAWSGAAWGALRALYADGVIAHLGVSVADPIEALDAAKDSDVHFIQLPFNLLDFRWEQAGVPAALAKRPDIIVYARSILLQGVLAEPKAEAWPKLPNLDVEVLTGWLQQQPARFGRVSAVDLCIAYVRAKDWIHGLVVGVESLTQMDGLLALFSHPELTAEAVSELEQTRPQVPVALLNPALWTC